MHALLLALVLSGCGPHLMEPVHPDPHGTLWVSELALDHPLVGKIYSVESGGFISESALVEAAGSHEIVLLGEKHDNPDHHLIQARMVRALATPQHIVAMEMLDRGMEAGDAATPREFEKNVGWSPGWGDFSLYAPIVQAALDKGARIVAANPSRDDYKTTARGGLHALPAEEVEALGLDRPLPPELEASLRSEIDRSHCGYAPEEMVGGLIAAQRLKDAWMARELTRHGGPAILVAGGGHTRADRGVPYYLEADPFVLMVLEVDRDELEPASYLDHEGRADAIWFTPRMSDVDPCDEFKAALEKMGGAEVTSHGHEAQEEATEEPEPPPEAEHGL